MTMTSRISIRVKPRSIRSPGGLFELVVTKVRFLVEWSVQCIDRDPTITSQEERKESSPDATRKQKTPPAGGVFDQVVRIVSDESGQREKVANLPRRRRR